MDMQYCGQPGFAPVFNFAQPAASNNPQFIEGQYPVHPGYYNYMYPFHQHRHHLMADRGVLHDGKTESKPRLSKEEVEKLEKIFQDNSKPSSSLKARLADELRLERPRINNWFQNRRAKAKQEKKQEEYEARRAAEKTSSAEPDSPDNDSETPASESAASDSHYQRMQPSSALFPDLDDDFSNTNNADGDDDEDDEQEREENHSQRDFTSSTFKQPQEASDAFQSPLSLDFSPTSEFAAFPPTKLDTQAAMNQQPYTSLISPKSNMDHASEAGQSVEDEEQSEQLLLRDDYDMTMASGASSQGFTTPNDSFKSPPPPADIASRRKLNRPAALNTAALKSRTMQPAKMNNPTSPAANMRRIASTTGNMAGRIQKPSPRSPMFFRNPEALLQYSARSPMGPITSPLGAPPTPMTPALMNQAGRDPVVASACSEDDTFGIGVKGIMCDFRAEANLKTPPQTPGFMAHLAAQQQRHHQQQPQYGGMAGYTNGAPDYTDQPLLTPYFQTEFSDLGLSSAHTGNVPSYVDMSDAGSMPSTPLYPHNMLSSIPESGAYNTGAAGSSSNNTQFDWDANEPVSASTSRHPSDAAVHFTHNMTARDYTP